MGRYGGAAQLRPSPFAGLAPSWPHANRPASDRAAVPVAPQLARALACAAQAFLSETTLDWLLIGPLSSCCSSSLSTCRAGQGAREGRQAQPEWYGAEGCSAMRRVSARLCRAQPAHHSSLFLVLRQPLSYSEAWTQHTTPSSPLKAPLHRCMYAQSRGPREACLQAAPAQPAQPTFLLRSMARSTKLVR